MSMLAQLLASVFERRERPAQIVADNRPIHEVIDDRAGRHGALSGRALAQEILHR